MQARGDGPPAGEVAVVIPAGPKTRAATALSKGCDEAFSITHPAAAYPRWL